MSGFHQVKIVQEGRKTEVSIDGMPIKAVRSVAYHNDVEGMPSVELQFYVMDAEIEIKEAEGENE